MKTRFIISGPEFGKTYSIEDVQEDPPSQNQTIMTPTGKVNKPRLIAKA